MCMGGGGGPDYGAIQAQQQAGVQKGIDAIGKAFSGFTPEFYQQRADDYVTAAMPQFQRQYADQLSGLRYRLANTGLLGSTAANKMGSDLQNYAAQTKTDIASKGLQASQDLQKQVAQSQAQITSQLLSSYDPSIAANQALQAASNFSAPSPLPALGNLFGNYANMYLTSQAASQPIPQYLSPYYSGASGMGSSFGPSLGNSYGFIK